MKRAEARSMLVQLANADATTAFSVGVAMLRGGHADILGPAASRLAATHARDARIHQLCGLAARANGDSQLALTSFARASELAPADPLIAHSHARSALEAGHPSLSLFEKAGRLAPSDGEIIRGTAAARLHDNSPNDALRFLGPILSANPLWIDGHRDAAHILAQMGRDPLGTIDAALKANPRSEALHLLAINTSIEAVDPKGAARRASEAQAAGVDNHAIRMLAAYAASETGNADLADRIFSSADTTQRIEDASLHARHLLRGGRAGQAARLLEPLIARDRDHYLWPYLSLAWRMSDDERWKWLEGDEELVGIYDLQAEIAKIDGLADLLRSLHFAKAQPLDQSVRGGTQTDGNLMLRVEAPILALRRLVESTVGRHVDRLPFQRQGHPTLLQKRSPLHFSGSWSVRLTDAGYHSDHVHSHGWISSALYLALPETMGDEHIATRDGWLSLGECRDVVPELAPFRLIEPRIGRLVLFPSTMWHGTRPFASGERLTVAFDIARPIQDPE